MPETTEENRDSNSSSTLNEQPLHPPDKGEAVSRPFTYEGLQVLRGLAATLVVVHHSSNLWSTRVAGLETIYGWEKGAAGVDIFFVLSGFVMAISNSRGRNTAHPARNFFLRRLARIMPMYWLSTAFVYFGLRIIDKRFHISPGYLVSSILLLPFKGPSGPIIPLNGIGWTLKYEMFFYFLFALALAVRIKPLRFLTPILIALPLIGIFYKDSWPAIGALATPQLLEFLGGMLIARYADRLCLLPSWILKLVALLSFLAIILGPFPPNGWLRVGYWGVEAALLVASIVGLEKIWSGRWPFALLLAGDASYSLYLTHLFTLTGMRKAAEHLHLHLAVRGDVYRYNEVLFILMCTAGAMAVGILLYKFVEFPIHRWLQGKLKRLDGPVAAGS